MSAKLLVDTILKVWWDFHKMDLIINQISILGGKEWRIRWKMMMEDVLFLIQDLCILGGGGLIFLNNCFFTKAKLNYTIMFWHMGLQHNWVPTLKLFQPFHFTHIQSVQSSFRLLRNIQTFIKEVEQTKGVWKDHVRYTSMYFPGVKSYLSIRITYDLVMFFTI